MLKKHDFFSLDSILFMLYDENNWHVLPIWGILRRREYGKTRAVFIPLGIHPHFGRLCHRPGKCMAEANEGTGIKFPAWARVYVTYVLPVVMIVLFAAGYWSKFVG